jgi:hypothetical protein
MPKLDDARDSYLLNHDLSNNLDVAAPAKPMVTAVYEAESVALSLEKDAVTKLRRNKELLQPLIVTALTDSRRVRAYMLALAAGMIELQENDETNVEEPYLTLNGQEYPLITERKLKGSNLPMLIAGLLSFVLAQDQFTPAFVDNMLALLQKKDDTDKESLRIRKRYGLWLKNDEWQIWIDKLPTKDRYGRKLVDDLLKVARLYADRYKL